MNARSDHAAPHAPRARRVAAILSMLAIGLTACGPSGDSTTSAAGGGLSIVTTTTVLGDVTRQIAGDAAQVSVLMEAGADPHNFEASARQLAQMQEADLIVVNGANLEEHLGAPLTEAEHAGVPVFHAIDHTTSLGFDAARSQEHTAEGAGHTDGGDPGDETARAVEDDHGHGAVDPHFWMDPTRMATVARALGEQIGGLTADGAAIEQRADHYAEQLEQVDREINDMLSGIPDHARTLVTSHEAFNYFAERYGFTIVGTVIPGLSTGAEPSAQDLEALAHTIEDQDVQAVFTENIAPEPVAETLAQEVGADVKVVELYSDSLGPRGSGATTYVDLLRTNAQRVSDALGR